jgi:hypothetical protein
MNKVLEMPTTQPAPATRFKVTALIDGFYVALEFEGDIHRLRAAIDGLKKIGATPSGQTAASGQKVEPAPVCQYHGPMKRSKFGDGWLCTKRMGNGQYCDQKS